MLLSEERSPTSSSRWKAALEALDERRRAREVRSRRAKVLVVDDDPDIRLTLRQVLCDEGFAVLEAKNGLEALESVADQDPDIVLLDLMMPIVTGWDVLKTLRNARKNLPVVILSAFPVGDDDGSDGTIDYVPKPISLARLLQLLATIDVRLKGRRRSRS
jgi:CheY-like chemotaxis protein